MVSRRCFLASVAAPLAAPLVGQPAEPIIDIHQHTNYSGRNDAELLAHQRAMGIHKTVLLPAGSKYGLAAGAGDAETIEELEEVTADGCDEVARLALPGDFLAQLVN